MARFHLDKLIRKAT